MYFKTCPWRMSFVFCFFTMFLYTKQTRTRWKNRKSNIELIVFERWIWRLRRHVDQIPLLWQWTLSKHRILQDNYIYFGQEDKDRKRNHTELYVLIVRYIWVFHMLFSSHKIIQTGQAENGKMIDPCWYMLDKLLKNEIKCEMVDR
jgi:hypothetical protein